MLRYWCRSCVGSGEFPAGVLIFLYASKRFCSSPAWRLDFPLRVESKPPLPMTTCAGIKEDSFFSLWKADKRSLYFAFSDSCLCKSGLKIIYLIIIDYYDYYYLLKIIYQLISCCPLLQLLCFFSLCSSHLNALCNIFYEDLDEGHKPSI